MVGRYRERLRPEDVAALETASKLPDLTGSRDGGR